MPLNDVFNAEGLDTLGLKKYSISYLFYKYNNSFGVKVNETNDFGLSSFYANFTPPKENVFLVVKYPDSVYALSYPKSEKEDLGLKYHDIIRKLL